MFFRSFLIISLLLYLFLGVSGQAIPSNWVDPYDMSPSEDYLKYSDQSDNIYSQKDTKSDPTILYLRRFINMLLNLAHDDLIDPEVYSGHLFFKLTSEKYQFLKDFQNGDSENLEKIDKILSEIFEKPRSEFLQKYLENTFHKCLNVLLSREGILAIVIICYSFVLYQLFKAHFSYSRILTFLFTNFLIFDFVFTWINLYQKFAAENIAKAMKYQEIPVECQPDKMNSLQFLLNMFSTRDKCKEYFEFRYEDIFYKVTPGLVLSEMFARIIQHPAQKLGLAFGQLCQGIYGSFPFPLNIILLPILLLFFCLLTCILLSIVLGKTIKLNLFYLITFSFGDSSSGQTNEDRISGQNLQLLLQQREHRHFIEHVTPETIDNRQQSTTIETQQQLKQIKQTTEQEIVDHNNGNHGETKESLETNEGDDKNASKSTIEEIVDGNHDKTKHSLETSEEKDKNASGDHI